MTIPQSTAARIPVRLLNTTNGNAVTGMLPANVSNGTSGSVTIAKGDGTTADLALTNGVNWFELHSTKLPGLYHILLPDTVTNVLGGLQVAVLPAAGAFVATVSTATVEDQGAELTAIAAGVANIDTNVTGLVASMANIEPAIEELHEHSFGRWEIFTTGPDANRLVLYQADGVTVLKKFALQNASGAPTTLNPLKRIPL